MLLANLEIVSRTNHGFLTSYLKAGLDADVGNGFSNTIYVMDQLKEQNPEGYEKVCYEIGEAYLFYYSIGVERDKYATAATWFQYVGENYPVAQMYCDISTCLQNITKYSKADQYAKLSEEYIVLWEQVKSLQINAEAYDDDLKLRVWNEIVSMINNNANEFYEVSSSAEILGVLNTIDENCSKVSNKFLLDNIEALRKNIDTTKKKVESIKIESAL